MRRGRSLAGDRLWGHPPNDAPIPLFSPPIYFPTKFVSFILYRAHPDLFREQFKLLLNRGFHGTVLITLLPQLSIGQYDKRNNRGRSEYRLGVGPTKSS
eukprot:3667048-Rhodomonas_salina.4